MRYLLLGLLLSLIAARGHAQGNPYGNVSALVLEYSRLHWNGTNIHTLVVEDDWVYDAHFTNLTSVSYLAIYNSSRLTNVNLPVMATHVGTGNTYFSINYNEVLRAISLPVLENSASALHFGGNTVLGSLELPALTNTHRYFTVVDNVSMTNLSLPALVSVATFPFLGFIATGCSNLTDVSFPNYLPSNGRYQSFDGCALSQASVDHILARCVASTGYVSGTVKLNGGFSSTPSAAGLIDVATLRARGVTVTHN